METQLLMIVVNICIHWHSRENLVPGPPPPSISPRPTFLSDLWRVTPASGPDCSSCDVFIAEAQQQMEQERFSSPAASWQSSSPSCRAHRLSPEGSMAGSLSHSSNRLLRNTSVFLHSRPTSFSAWTRPALNANWWFHPQYRFFNSSKSGLGAHPSPYPHSLQHKPSILFSTVFGLSYKDSLIYSTH